MATLQGSWIWYELMTPDPEAARAFYEPVVGWSMTTAHGADDSYGFITGADGQMTGGVLRLSQEMRDHGAAPRWLGYVAVDDCDAAVAAITAAGGHCTMPPRDVEMAGRMAMVSDCCGAPFYIMTPTPPPGGGQSTAFSPARIGACGWNELLAGDQAKALEFYTGLFGWTLPEGMPMGDLGTYQFIAHDGVQIGAVVQRHPQISTPPGWNHYFRVTSIADAVRAIETHGGQIVTGPHPVPGDDWIVQATDPQGGFFCLVGAKGD